MSQRSKATELLSEYFEKKGEILHPAAYMKEKDTPIRLQVVRRTFGSWSRMENIVRAFDARNKNRPEPDTNINEVLAEQNKIASDREALIRSIGEDIEQKTAREEAARAQTEADALNAATPEGARENKIRKGGIESVDAKTIKESVARAVANEHAMLAKTPEGAALGKELLGGVEDQDEKNLAIARQNARTERSALLAATPEGSALAKMEEDDSDGHLTREAQARLRNELRPYVAPALPEQVEDIVAGEIEKVRPEAREAVENLRNEDDLSQPAALRGDRAHDADGAVTEGDLSKSPPATRVADDTLVGQTDESLKKAGLVRDAKPTAAAKTATAATTKTETKVSAPAKENKDSVNKAENEENPEAPPADRNPDPKVAQAAKTTPPKK